MPIDATLPRDGALITATELRSLLGNLQGQITALNQTVANLQQQMNNQIAGTARNPNGSGARIDGWEPNDPPTADDLRFLRDQHNTLYDSEAR